MSTSPLRDRPRRKDALLWPVILALAIAQIISWGSLFYAFSVLLGPLQQETKWGRDAIVGAFSLSVLVTGLGATPAGMLIDRFGGRVVMALGSLCAALVLALMSQVHTLAMFYVAWGALGAAGSMLLYEPAFAVVYRNFPGQARGAITALTLLAGFASTIFWPLTDGLVTATGWRNTFLALGAMNLFLCLPLHAFFIPRNTRESSVTDSAPSRSSHSPQHLGMLLRTPSFWLLALAFTANILAFACLSVHLIPLLQEKGFSAHAAVWLAALIGPMQVGGRIVEFVIGRRASPNAVALVALGLLPVGLVALAFASPAGLWGFVFVALYGASNGVMTIVRAVIPAERYGREHYGAVNGALAALVIVARAAGPFAGSLLWTWSGGYPVVVWFLVATATCAVILFYFASHRP